MAHNLNFNEKLGREAFFSVKEKPWHKLGVVVDKSPTAAEALVLGGLDYNVAKGALYADTPDGGKMVENHFSTYRTDTNQVMGIVGRKYQPLQNRDAFSFFDSIIEAGEAVYETAGALGHGEIVFITAKLKNQISVGDDKIEQYVFLTNSHDGSSCVVAAITPVRIVCNNTLCAALNTSSDKITLRHTKSVAERIKLASRLMETFNNVHVATEQEYNLFANTSITDENVRKLVEEVFKPKKEEISNASSDFIKEMSKRTENTIDFVMDYYRNAPEQKAVTGNLYGVVNGVTGYFQNRYQFRSNNAKVKSILFGGVKEKTSKTIELCRKLV